MFASRVAGVALRTPPPARDTRRAMSEENVETIRTLFEAFLRRDTKTMAALLAPQVEWDATRSAGLVPDLAGVYGGPEGTRKFWRAWLSPWKNIEFDFELRDAGSEVVALVRNQRQWGRHSDVETEGPPYAWLYTVVDGKVVRGRFFPDHRSALQAAGLEE
jgi:ketosteroid isomerase-like protein